MAPNHEDARNLISRILPKKTMNKKNIRQFESGATRDISEGKIEYFGFRHPLCEHSFGKYMHKHRTQSDGNLRDSNNWWKGWDTKISLQSLNRHLEDLNAIHAGYVVVKIRDNGEERTEYLSKDIMDKIIKDYKDLKYEIVTAEDCLNAIRFNSQAYLLNLLKNK